MQVPGLNLSSAGHYNSDADKGLLAPIASLLEGQYSRQALQVGLAFQVISNSALLPLSKREEVGGDLLS